MRNPVPKLRAFLRSYRWRALLPGWLILISGSWVADGLKGEVLFGDWAWGRLLAEHRWLGLAFAVLCFVLASLWLYSYRRDFERVRSLSQDRCTPHRSLVVLVSTPNPVPHEERDGSLRLPAPDGREIRLPAPDRQEMLATDKLDHDIDRVLSGIRWNWQQLLRGVRPHAGMIERVCLVGSPGERGSFQHLDLCEKMLRRYLGAEVVIARHHRKVDFEDFNGLVRELRGIVTAEKRAGMTDEDIVIDITGGPKTASIAGSAITFSTEVTFQYVQTNTPFAVYAYDVDQQPLPER